MNLKSLVSPDTGAVVGVLTGIGVYMIYNDSMPTVTDLRMADPHNADADSARKSAAIKSASLVGVVYLVTRNFEAFIIGGAALVGVDFQFKYANAVHPATGKIDRDSSATSIAPTVDTEYPLDDYAGESTLYAV